MQCVKRAQLQLSTGIRHDGTRARRPKSRTGGYRHHGKLQDGCKGHLDPLHDVASDDTQHRSKEVEELTRAVSKYKASVKAHLDALHDVAGDDAQHGGEQVGAHQPHEVHKQLPGKGALAQNHHPCKFGFGFDTDCKKSFNSNQAPGLHEQCAANGQNQWSCSPAWVSIQFCAPGMWYRPP